MQDQVDRLVGRRLLDRSDDRLRVLKVDMAGDVEAEEAALLLPVDHRDDARAVRLFDRAIACARLTRKPAPHEHGLQRHAASRSNQWR